MIPRLCDHGCTPKGVSDRERFIAVLASRMPLRADVLVVLAGEDAKPRCEFAAAAFERGFAPKIFVTGGRDDKTRYLGAEHCKGLLMGLGVAPDRIETDTTAMNTREQAINTLAKGFERPILCASAYHMVRAFLTFLKVLHERGETETVRLVPGYVSNAWHQVPDGMEQERLDLLAMELGKIEQYGSLGHVATYREGLDYLKAWESKP